MAHLIHHVDMTDAPRPTANIEARLCGRHYYLDSKVELSGRGVTFRGQLTENELVAGSRKVGWFQYRVTLAAFKKITTQHDVVSDHYLD